MKRIIILILIILCITLNLNNINAEENDSLIKIGMNFLKIEKNWKKLNAQETDLSITYPEGYGQTNDLKVYIIPDIEPFIIIEYLIEDNSITGLSLYYEYQHKMDPNNKWLNVEEIDLKKLKPITNQAQWFPMIYERNKNEKNYNECNCFIMHFFSRCICWKF